MSEKRPVKCIIFDSDGTLVDSEHLGHYCIELKLREIGVFVPAKKLKEDYCGWQLGVLLKDLQRQHNCQYPDDFISDYRVKLSAMFELELKAIAGVSAAIEKITVPICVASSGPMSKIETAMRVTGLKKYFADKLFSAYDLGVWKPEPGLFLHAAVEMGFKPEECVVVEDSRVGVQAALAAGMRVVYYNPEGIELSDLQPTAEIDNMDQLIATLEVLGL